MIDSVNLKTITNILNDFLEPFDCVAEPGEDFCYHLSSNTINFAFVVVDKYEKTFMEFVEKLFPRINANPFLWSFLHELGHHETEDDFEDEEWSEYTEAVHGPEPIDDFTYYNLPIERAATKWAGNFMIEHENEVRELWYKLVPAIYAFYKEMEVDINEA